MAKNLFTLTVKTTTPADSELLVGGTGSANAYNFTWTKLKEWVANFGANTLIAGRVRINNTTDAPNSKLVIGDALDAGSGTDAQIENSLRLGGSLLMHGATSGTKSFITDATATKIITDGGFDIASDLSADGTAIDFVTSGTVLTVGVGADNGTVSAGIFTDRTKHFDGDGLKAIKDIKGSNGELDHKTLPDFARVHLKKKTIIDKKEVETIEEGRDLGGMISILTKGLQEQIDINKDLTDRIKQLEDV